MDSIPDPQQNDKQTQTARTKNNNQCHSKKIEMCCCMQPKSTIISGNIEKKNTFCICVVVVVCSKINSYTTNAKQLCHIKSS
jgi:hypothetical protein